MESSSNIKPNSFGKLMLILSIGSTALMIQILVITQIKILMMFCGLLGFLIPIFSSIGIFSGLYNIIINRKITLPNFFITFIHLIIVFIALVGLYVVYGMKQYN